MHTSMEEKSLTLEDVHNSTIAGSRGTSNSCYSNYGSKVASLIAQHWLCVTRYFWMSLWPPTICIAFAVILLGCGNLASTTSQTSYDAQRDALRQQLQQESQQQPPIAPSAVSNQSPLIGTWEDASGKSHETYNADGTGEDTAYNVAGVLYRDRLFTWKDNAGTVTVVYSADLADPKDDWGIKHTGINLTYSYTINGNTLHPIFGVPSIDSTNLSDEYRIR